MDIMISGFYGFNNSGDDAVLLGIIASLQKEMPGISMSVLSNNAKATEQQCNIKAISRNNIYKILKEMKQAKVFISGGGSLIQDVTSTRSILYYLGLIWLAKKCGLKVILYANGIGPVNSVKNRKRCKKILNKVDYITLRDEISMDEIRKMGIHKRIPVELTPDPAFAVKAYEGDQETQIVTKYELSEDYIVVSIRRWGMDSEVKFDVIAKACDMIAQRNQVKICLMPLYPQEDSAVCYYIAGKMKTKSIVIDSECEVRTLLTIIKNSRLVIGMRLHSIIYAISMGVPFVGISYDPKVDGIVNQVDENIILKFDHISEEVLVKMVEDVMGDNKKYTDKIHQVAIKNKEKELRNARIIKKLLGEKT